MNLPVVVDPYFRTARFFCMMIGNWVYHAPVYQDDFPRLMYFTDRHDRMKYYDGDLNYCTEYLSPVSYVSCDDLLVRMALEYALYQKE